MTSTRIQKTDPDENGSRQWLRDWAKAVRKDSRVHNAAIVTALVLAEYAWTSKHTVAMSSRRMAELTGRSRITESEHLKQLWALGWWYETGKHQNRKPVLQLQFPAGWEHFQGRDKPSKGWLSETEDDAA
jgi:hypothetical protein